MNVQHSPSELLLDEAAGLIEIVQSYEQTIYLLALNLTGSTKDAEEVLADVFLKVFAAPDIAGLKANPVLALVRETVAAATTLLETRAYSVLRVANEPEGSEDVRLGQAIQENLQKLPFEYRKVFVLKQIFGLSYFEVCQVLAISEDDCRARLGRARLMLRRSLMRDRVTIQAIESIDASKQAGQKPQLFV